jgi:hypothetical protein
MLAALVLALPRVVAAQGQGRGRGHGKGERAAVADQSSTRVIVRHVFSDDDERELRRWFLDDRNRRGLPPGLAKRDRLPPGLRMQVLENGELPPGLEKQLQPLPWRLERRFPRLPRGIQRRVLGDDVLVWDSTTRLVLDVLRDVLRD